MTKRYDLPKQKAVIGPEGGWKPCTYYVCWVACNKCNPMHKCIFYSGFIDDKGKPQGYAKAWGGSWDGPMFLQELYYLEAISEVADAD